MEDAAKLAYLKQSLTDEPREMLKGLPNTDANYTIAVAILRERCDDPSKQTHALLKFHNLSSPKHNAKDLRSFLNGYRKVKKQIKGVTDFAASELG